MQAGPHVDRVHARGRGRPTLAEHVEAARAGAAEAGFRATGFQVFVAGPRNLVPTLTDEEADGLRAYLDERPELAVISHGTYMDFPWGGNHYLARFIRGELAACARAGIAGLVVHLGKPPVDVVREILPRLLTEHPVLIYLETPHLKPENSHYETPEKLARLFRSVRELDPGLCRFALCVDTAHLWSSGADIQSYRAAADWLRRLELQADVIPPDRVAFHLNDSYDARGSGADHHAPLLQGELWGPYRETPHESGLAAFVEYMSRHRSLVILERGGGGKGAGPPAELLDDYAVLARMDPGLRAPEIEPSPERERL